MKVHLYNFLCSFNTEDTDDLANETDWNKAATKVRTKVYEGFRTVVKGWEVDTEITEGTVARVQSAIEREFPAFEMEIDKIEREMTGRPESNHTPMIHTEEEDGDLVPEFLRKKFENLAFGTKLALGVGLSPLLLAGLVVRLPYVGYKALERFIIKHRMESDFKAALSNKMKLKEVCERYSEKTMTSITNKLSLKTMIEEDMQVLFKFLELQKQRMQGQIKLDIELLQKLKYEESEQADIEKFCEPLNAKCKMLTRHLKHFMLLYNSSYYLKNTFIKKLTISDTVICGGVIADVHSAMCQNKGRPGETALCVRKQKNGVKISEVLKYIKVLEAYRYSNA